MNLIEQIFNFKKRKLQKLILGSFFVSFAIVLSQINKFCPIFFNKSLYTENNYFCYWYFPFFMMSLFFDFSSHLFFLLFYCFIDIFVYSSERYLFQIQFLTNNYLNKPQVILLFYMIFFGTIIPVLSYSLTSFFTFFIKKNIKKNFLFLFIIILIQTISRFFCGFLCYWGPNTKYYFILRNNINIFNKSLKSSLFYYSFMFFWNFLPILISNLILFILFSIFKSFILKNFKFYWLSK